MTEPLRPARGADHVRDSRRIDGVDKQLITMLQVNGRASYAGMARHIGASEAAVRNRVARLRRDGLIQIVAVTDPLHLGFHYEAMVAINAGPDAATLADSLAEINEVSFVVLVCGRFDILLEIVAETDEQFLAVLHCIREQVDHGTVLVLPYLKTWMQEYTWGVAR